MSSRRAGVTRALRWVRVGQSLDLLDAPGVLPPRLDDQQAALKLALCDDIGQAAYDVGLVAICFLKLLHQLQARKDSGVPIEILEQRYGIPFEIMDAEKWLIRVAELHTSGEKRRMAQRLLDDFRKALLGLVSLELPS